MNLFKKALVATAVAASFGASAATVLPSTTSIKLSAEGVAAGVTPHAAGFDFNVTTGAETSGGATITLTFSDGIDIGPLTITNAVDNTSTAGKGDAGHLVFDYGNGSFTFDNVVVVDGDQTKGESDTVSFDVGLGQPLAKGASFNVAFAATATIAKASTADYSAVFNAVETDTGTGTVASELTQFAFSVKTPLDAVIERTAMKTFTDGGVTDDLVVTINNYEDLDMSITPTTLTDVGYDMVITGDFTGFTAAEIANDGVSALSNVTVNGGADFITFDISDQDIVTSDGTGDEFTVTFTRAAAAVITATGDVEIDFSVNSVDIPTTGTLAIATAAAGGEWAVDATIINVPYLPVGFEGTSSQVNLANDKSVAVDVIVSAYDAAGNVYPAVDLGFDLPANTVTKVSQTLLMDLLDVPAESKLSVTFNIDANEGDVNGYAFTSSAAGRAEISTSQQRGN